MTNLTENTSMSGFSPGQYNTTGAYPDKQSLVLASEKMEIVLLPIIISTGIIGNTLSFFVFLTRKLRTLSCILYLTAKAVSDTIFLLCLLVIWLEKVNVSFFHSRGVCQVVVYLTYVTGFISVWLIVLVTYENYVRICHPMRIVLYCRCIKAKQYICFLISVSAALYSFSLLSNHVVDYGGFLICTPKDEAVVLLTIFTYVDTALTLFLPSVVILGFLVATLVTTKTKRRLAESKATQNLQRQVTRLLTAISVTIWGLSLPSYVIRIRLLIIALVRDEVLINSAEYFSQHFFQILYYSGFAINIIIYVCCGRNFRQVMIKAVKCLQNKMLCRLKKTHPTGCTHLVSDLETSELTSALFQESQV